MNRKLVRPGRHAAAFLVSAILMAGQVRVAGAQETGYRIADGLAIYLGVAPAEIVKGHPKGQGQLEHHGATTRDEHSYHLIVAVFDDATGARVTDIQVDAIVRPPARPPKSTALEKMQIDGTTTYGNYVMLGGYGMYKIVIEVRRPGAAKPAVAEFTYDHPLDHPLK